jgi:hypothetical protein
MIDHSHSKSGEDFGNKIKLWQEKWAAHYCFSFSNVNWQPDRAVVSQFPSFVRNGSGGGAGHTGAKNLSGDSDKVCRRQQLTSSLLFLMCYHRLLSPCLKVIFLRCHIASHGMYSFPP